LFFFFDEERPVATSAKEQSSETQDLARELETEIDEAIGICSGDIRAALRATLVANSFLEGELKRLTEAISTGFARGRIRKPPKRTKN
jgi:hypothetical protein